MAGADPTAKTSLVTETDLLGKAGALSRVKATPATLLVLDGPQQGAIFELTATCQFIGREEGAQFILADPKASRAHAELTVNSSSVWLRDNGSTNGTFVNDRRLQQEAVELRKGDYIRIGSTLMKFLPAGELETYFQNQLQDAAQRDGLTGALNKATIMQQLGASVRTALADRRPLSVVLFDLDHFKRVNDQHGHDAGDVVLRETAGLVRSRLLPAGASLGRFGGEEFLILLPRRSQQEATTFAERLRSSIESSSFVHGHMRLSLTISVGVAMLDNHSDTAPALFKRADEALYKAKNSGRNRVCCAP